MGVAVDRQDPDPGVLREGTRIGVADERNSGAVGRHRRLAVLAVVLGERTDVAAVSVAIAVGRHGDDVQVARSVPVPRLVSSRRGHDGARIAQPADAGVLELARRQVARRPGAVRRDDVDVVRAVEDPVLPVESAEESLDLAG
jgi:hypothetical protein